MGLKKDLLVAGAVIVGIGVLSVLTGDEKGTNNSYLEDDDLLMDDWDDDDNDFDGEYFSQSREIPDGYVELYDGSIARLSDVEDLDDLADPTDYYR